MKKTIIAFILGGILFSTITATAAYVYTARDIGYQPQDENWSVSNASEALSSLKSDLNTVNTNVTEYKQQITEALADKGVEVDENSSMADIQSGINNMSATDLLDNPDMLSSDYLDKYYYKEYKGRSGSVYYDREGDGYATGIIRTGHKIQYKSSASYPKQGNYGYHIACYAFPIMKNNGYTKLTYKIDAINITPSTNTNLYVRNPLTNVLYNITSSTNLSVGEHTIDLPANMDLHEGIMQIYFTQYVNDSNLDVTFSEMYLHN